MNTMITSYVENKEDSEFYPTPKNLVEKMLSKVNWDYVYTVLEPSAGKGDILCGMAKNLSINKKRDIDVDYIEIDSNLRSIIKHRFSEAAKKELKERREKIAQTNYIKKDFETGKYKYLASPVTQSNVLALTDNETKGSEP